MRSSETKEKVLQILNDLRKTLLLIGQSSLPESQFEAFRRLTLDAFGKAGAEGAVDRLFEGNTDNH